MRPVLTTTIALVLAGLTLTSPAVGHAEPSEEDLSARRIQLRLVDPAGDVRPFPRSPDLREVTTRAERRLARRADIQRVSITIRRAAPTPHLRFRVRADDVVLRRGRVAQSYYLQTGYAQLVVRLGRTAPSRMEVWSPDETEAQRCRGTRVVVDLRGDTVTGKVPLACLNRVPVEVRSGAIDAFALVTITERDEQLAAFRDVTASTREVPLTPWRPRA